MARTTNPVFGGRKFKYYSTHDKKRNAEAVKFTLKKKGYLVRIRETYGQYTVFYHIKGQKSFQ